MSSHKEVKFGNVASSVRGRDSKDPAGHCFGQVAPVPPVYAEVAQAAAPVIEEGQRAEAATEDEVVA